MNAPAVRLTRFIAAPPERVYRLWLDPDQMVRWFAPEGFEVARAEVDERVGGRYRIWHAEPDGTATGGAEADILELVPNERIVLAWRFVGPDREGLPGDDSRLTITLAAVDGGTELVLVHDFLDTLRAARPDVAGGVERGWASALDRLPAVL